MPTMEQGGEVMEVSRHSLGKSFTTEKKCFVRNKRWGSPSLISPYSLCMTTLATPMSKGGPAPWLLIIILDN